MNTDQGKVDIVAGAHDDVQVMETAGNQTSQVANIENDAGAQAGVQSRKTPPGDLSTQVEKIDHNAGAQDGAQSEEASPGDYSAQVAKD